MKEGVFCQNLPSTDLPVSVSTAHLARLLQSSGPVLSHTDPELHWYNATLAFFFWYLAATVLYFDSIWRLCHIKSWILSDKDFSQLLKGFLGSAKLYIVKRKLYDQYCCASAFCCGFSLSSFLWWSLDKCDSHTPVRCDMTGCVWRAEEVRLSNVSSSARSWPPFSKKEELLSWAERSRSTFRHSKVSLPLSRSLSVSMYFCFEFTFCKVCQFSLAKSSAATLLYVWRLLACDGV